MSVVGIDFGNLNTVIAVARNRGIDVITNETTNRLTPSQVSFGIKQRYLGEQAKSNEISNFRNTVHTLKRLAGRLYSDPDVQSVESKYLNCSIVAHEQSGEAAVQLQYLNESREFTFTQLCGAFLTKIKQITTEEIKVPCGDVVLSVPGWFGDRQRRAVIDACEIAGLNCLRLLNDGTSAALGYGLTKPDLPDPTAKPRKVVFVDIGHSSTQCSCVEFVKGQLKVKASAYDRNLGGRDFDDALTVKVAEDMEKKYKGMELRTNKRAMFRLRSSAEKAKKMLSANSATVLSVESIVEDRDVSMQLERADFEALTVHLVDRVLGPLEKAMQIAGWTAEEVDSVELIGGSTRIPAVKQKFAHFFGDDLTKDALELKISTTMNADEAIARGNALMCAMISPVFKVRDFAVTDWNSHAVEITWDGTLTTSGEVAGMEAFPTGNGVPSTKQLTFYRKLPNPLPPSGVDFSIKLSYLPAALDLGLPAGLGSDIGVWTVTGIKPVDDLDNKEKACVRVKAKLSADGLFEVADAQLVEEKVVVVEGEEKKDEAVPMETDQPAEGSAENLTPEAAAPPASTTGPKTKKTVKKYPLTITAATPSLSQPVLLSYRDIENSMASQDKLVADTEYARNALEEYVYYVRGKMGDEWAEYVDPASKKKLEEMSGEAEEWLYTEEGEEAGKSVFQERLGGLKKLGDPIALRYRESELRPTSEKSLRDILNSFALQLQSTDDRFSHIAATDLQKAKDEVERVTKWLNDSVKKQNERKKYEDVAVRADEMDTAKQQLLAFVTPIITKPKPKPKPEEKKPETPEPKTETNGTNGDVPMNGDAPKEGGKKVEEDTDMD